MPAVELKEATSSIEVASQVAFPPQDVRTMLQEVPSQESEGRGGEATEVLPHLLPELKEEVCARLPLAHMARAALVSKSWASTYASCLASRQQQLKDLAPASAISAVQASLDAWEHVTTAVPDAGRTYVEWLLTELMQAHLDSQNSSAASQGEGSTRFTATFSMKGISTTWSMSSPHLALLHTSCETTAFGPSAYGELGTLLVTLEFQLESAESLPWVVGLLLKLAQEVPVIWELAPQQESERLQVLPVKCGGEMREQGGPRIVMKVRCQVEGETGWEDWAPLAPLCRAVRLTVSPPTAPALPWRFTQYAVIARSPRGWGSPVGLLHIKARWWEPASCWSLREGAGPPLLSAPVPTLRCIPYWKGDGRRGGHMQYAGQVLFAIQSKNRNLA